MFADNLRVKNVLSLAVARQRAKLLEFHHTAALAIKTHEKRLFCISSARTIHRAAVLQLLLPRVPAFFYRVLRWAARVIPSTSCGCFDLHTYTFYLNYTTRKARAGKNKFPINFPFNYRSSQLDLFPTRFQVHIRTVNLAPHNGVTYYSRAASAETV